MGNGGPDRREGKSADSMPDHVRIVFERGALDFLNPGVPKRASDGDRSRLEALVQKVRGNLEAHNDDREKEQHDSDTEIRSVIADLVKNVEKKGRVKRMFESRKAYFPGLLEALNVEGDIDKILGLLKDLYAYLVDGKDAAFDEGPDGNLAEKVLRTEHLEKFLAGDAEMYAFRIPQIPYYLCFMRKGDNIGLFYHSPNEED